MTDDSNLNNTDTKKDNRKIISMLEEFWHLPCASLDAYGHVKSRSLYGVPTAYAASSIRHDAIITVRWDGKRLIIKKRK